MSTPSTSPTPPMHAPLPAGVECLLAPNPSLLTGLGTNTFLVTDAASGAVVVIDPGPDDVPDHLHRIAETVAARGTAQAILVTHGHPDHADGAAALRDLLGVPVFAWSREGVPATDVALADGEMIAVGGRRLRALHTPGHRFDHLCFLLEDAETLFVGDLIAGEGTVVIAPPEGDLLDYRASLHRLLALDLRLILPAHGPAIADPRAVLTYYISHREAREQQVLGALAAAAGPQTVMQLVEVIYVDVNSELHPVAAHSVLAHLYKLEREGRVHRVDEERWSLGT
jgi:glyoxylase-like metal-dependent hydrolase (beta-lactamase superfamily II)